MYSEIFYLIRSKLDGKYLVAHPKTKDGMGYLILFKEHFDALSYLNKYAEDVRDRFSVESLPGSQLKSLVKRWEFEGVGIVQDPLLPQIEFL
ncbi:MAG: hypothetical protein RLZZ338_4742 [Cyanobacteriota bacterium]|jgi:hypothetical protein